VTLLLLVVLAAGACGGGDGNGEGNGEGLSVMATTPVLAALVQGVTGDVASVASVIPAGTDPHAYQASARERSRMLQADLLVVNGADLEEGLLDVIDETAKDGVPVLVAMDAVEARRYPGGELDPHFWHDPEQAGAVVVAIGDRMADLDPVNAGGYREAAASFSVDLDRLTGEISAMFAALRPQRRLLVTNHDAYRYFTARFGFEVLGTILPGRSTDAVPSPAHLAGLAASMRERKVCAVFAEEEESTSLAEALAREVGPDVAVVTLFAGTLPDGYEDLLRENAACIAGTLARCG